MFRNTIRARSKSRERPTKKVGGKTEGYACALYEDFLVLFGSRMQQDHYPGGANLCVYNLKKQKSEVNSDQAIPGLMFLPSACTMKYRERQSILFYLTSLDEPTRGTGGGGGGFGSRGGLIRNPSAGQIFLGQMQEDTSGNMGCHLEPAMPGPATSGPGNSSSICHYDEEKMYVYSPSEENANFGSLDSYSLIGGGNWDKIQGSSENLRLNQPSQNSIFIKDVLYVFSENVDHPIQMEEEGYSLIEDIYTLSLRSDSNNSTWERTSPSGRVPGALTHISMAGADGMIYVFGSSQEKPVLWVYDINKKEWKQVRGIETLTARSNQKAMVYKGQLLIINWNYSKDSVEIQYFSLDDMNFVTQSEDGKDLCKDQPDNLVSDAKNLFNGRLFPDVVFEIEGEEIPAHKAILAYRSNYFMKMFTSGMSESHSAKIPISNMKFHIFKAILQYIYCNELELDEQLALDLIPVVDEYLMKGLKGLCEKYLCKQLRKDNVVDLLIVADRHEIDDLKKACFKYILKNLGNIDENEEMLKLSKSLFIELLKFSAGLSDKKESKSHNQGPHQQEEIPLQSQAMSGGVFRNAADRQSLFGVARKKF